MEHGVRRSLKTVIQYREALHCTERFWVFFFFNIFIEEHKDNTNKVKEQQKWSGRYSTHHTFSIFELDKFEVQNPFFLSIPGLSPHDFLKQRSYADRSKLEPPLLHWG